MVFGTVSSSPWRRPAKAVHPGASMAPSKESIAKSPGRLVD